MKKILYFLLIPLIAVSCKIDNVDAPEASITGVIADAKGVALQMEQGGSSGRIRMEELSWSDNPLPVYLNFKQDGSYINNKIFAGNYRMTPVEGAFYPVAESIVDIRNSVTQNFTVVPYLNVDWVGEPIVTTDKKVSVTFKFTRNPAPAGLTQPNPLDYQLYISTNQFVGNNNWDNTAVGAVVPATVAMEGQNLTITSTVPMKYATKYFLRVGVRVNDTFKKYNYNTVKTVTIP
jgi:hypothetical protein